jgi:hypothetical protein
LIVTAAYTGMRWGELARPQWHNVDLDTLTSLPTGDVQAGCTVQTMGDPPVTAITSAVV